MRYFNQCLNWSLIFWYTILGIPVGNIAGVSLKRVLAPKGDIEAALQAIEQIAGQGQGQNPLRSFNGGAYALITKIGMGYNYLLIENNIILEICAPC